MSNTRTVDVQLSQQQIDFFQREGYLAVDAVTDDQELQWLREAYDRIFRERAGREEGMEFNLAGPDTDEEAPTLPQILNPSKYVPELNQTKLLANVQRLGEQLVGSDAKAGFAHAIYKPPHHGAETPWHQDASYWPPHQIHRQISIWVPLQEATPENGCMEFIPRSHELDVIKHQSIGGDPSVHGNELHPDEMWRVNEDNVVQCPLPPGGATMHGGYMLHHTGPNTSDVPRRALILMAAAPGTPREQPIRLPWQEEKQTAREERAKKWREAQEQ